MRLAMQGKTVVITGGSAGIGKATAAELAARGARVILACRDLDKAEAARAELVARNPDAALEVVLLELRSLRSVRDCATKLRRIAPRIDVLINNAGVFPPTLRVTLDGFEEQFGVNHLGHFLLTNLLIENLVAAAPARVVTVSSMMHAGGKLDFASFRSPAQYNAYAAYRQSKLANILFANELARKLATRGVTSNSLHPGGVATEIMRDANLALRLLARVAFTTPEKGARTSVHLASSPDVAGLTGRYFVSSKPAKTDPLAQDTALAAQLWEESAKLSGLGT
jgi:NAD(P)-dependent dehydrogenase (short-subunit alcohol dehydrogenase family)